MEIIADHKGVPVKHGRAFVNGVRLHYYVAGKVNHCSYCMGCRRLHITGVE